MAAPDPHRPSLLRRRGWWITVATVIPLLIGFAWLGETWAGRRALESARARLAAEGFETDPAKLLPPRPPDDENFCGTPFLLAVGSGTASGPQIESIRRIKGQGIPWESIRKPSNLVPTDWANVRDRLAAADPSLGLVIGGSDPANELSAALERALGPVLAELAGALDRPHSAMVPGYLERAQNPERLLAALPWFNELGSLASILDLRTRLDVELGSDARAIQSLRMTHRLAEGADADGFVVGRLLAISARTLARSSIWVAADARGFDEQQWRELGRVLHQPETLKGVDATLGIELHYMEHSFDRLRSNPDEIFEPASLPGGIPPFWRRAGAQLIPSGWFDFNHAQVIHGMADLRRRVLDPSIPDRFDWRKWESELDAGAGFRFHRRFRRMVLPSESHVVRTIATDHALCRLAEAACGLEAHCAGHGSYPATLEALVPGSLSEVPFDLDGEPVRYALDPRNGRYKLWSVGLNGTDEGGVEMSDRPGGKPLLWKEPVGDWVWEFP